MTRIANNPEEQLWVTGVTRNGHLKRLRLEPSLRWLEVPLSACVSTGDQVHIIDDKAWVLCNNGKCQFLPPYSAPDVLHLGGLTQQVLVKEITEPEEHAAYCSLTGYHYRGQRIHGRTARLIVRTFHPGYPTVIGYIELATPFFMSKARAKILNTSFEYGDISWNHWDMPTLRKYIHLMVRIARTVVSPEFRGIGVGQVLVKHTALFAAQRWQVSGYLPYFLEISADMLKYVPFAEKAGMLYIGDTEGNLARVAKDMEYLIGRFGEDGKGKRQFEKISGILDQQVARMDRSLKLMAREGMSVADLTKGLKHLSQKTVLRDYALFHGIVSLPKPNYMMGLNQEASRFLGRQVQELGISNSEAFPAVSITPLSALIRFNDFTVTYLSKVRRTLRTHAVQQAFGISPEDIQTTVLQGLTLNIQPGSIVLVVGPSGSGKTTLLEAVTGKIKKHRGVTMTGLIDIPPDCRPATFQPIRSEKPLIELLGTTNVRLALYLLGLAGLSEPALYLKRFQELSRGQQYRAMLARLIASGSNTWIADEFCTNLDPVTANVAAYNVQRIARKLGITLIAAAPHCTDFILSLNPDTVVALTSSWEYHILTGLEYKQMMTRAQSQNGSLPSLRVFPELLDAVKGGTKRATVRKGWRSFEPGLLMLLGGNETVIVRVTSTDQKQLSALTDEDAYADGAASVEALRNALLSIYPGLGDRSTVTVIHFEPLCGEVQHQAKVIDAPKGTRP
ncbi:MAG: Cell division ATP-binding protein FtsE [Dehalococcoidia bacterium]|nr:Cell division ATP-binding protein FtsE [Bacillota bacterium]MBT9142337.1 Cell division ATP-binding protein FtsE [Bacillota bacterium]